MAPSDPPLAKNDSWTGCHATTGEGSKTCKLEGEGVVTHICAIHIGSINSRSKIIFFASSELLQHVCCKL